MPKKKTTAKTKAATANMAISVRRTATLFFFNILFLVNTADFILYSFRSCILPDQCYFGKYLEKISDREGHQSKKSQRNQAVGKVQRNRPGRLMARLPSTDNLGTITLYIFCEL